MKAGSRQVSRPSSCGNLTASSQLEQRDPTGFILGPLFAVLGLASLAPSVVAVVLAVRRDRHISQLLDAWLRLDSHPPTDDRLRSSGLSLFWLLSSLVVCAFGLWTSFAGVAEARPGRDAYSDVVLVMGIGFILWLTGLIGVAKAVRHYRWAVRVLGPRTRHRHRHRHRLPGDVTPAVAPWPTASARAGSTAAASSGPPRHGTRPS